MKEQQAKKTVYTTLRGKEVPYRAINTTQLGMAQAGLRDEWIKRGEPLDPPTYQVEYAGGETKEVTHDEKSLDQVGDPVENHKRWEAYKDASTRFQRACEDIMLRFVMEDALLLEKPKDWSDSEEMAWEKRQKRIHIQVPDDPEDKWIHYVGTEILETAFDAKAFFMTVLSYSNQGSVDQEAIKLALASFQGPIPAQ